MIPTVSLHKHPGRSGVSVLAVIYGFAQAMVCHSTSRVTSASVCHARFIA